MSASYTYNLVSTPLVDEERHDPGDDHRHAHQVAAQAVERPGGSRFLGFFAGFLFINSNQFIISIWRFEEDIEIHCVGFVGIRCLICLEGG
jgi:hypothetical protein